MTHTPHPLPFTCEKRPATGALGVVVTNSPLGSAAGSEMLAAGGNAIDAAVAALFTLTVVEPMMVGIAGGGMSHPRLADGRHVIIDAMSTAGRAARNSDMYEPLTGMEVAGRKNTIGPVAVAVAGNLGGWCLMQERYGKLPFADVIEPAIRAASRGFTSHYLHGALREHEADLLVEPNLSDAIRQGRLRGAGIDVFSVEAVAPDKPLLGLDRVIMTPHLGAGNSAGFGASIQRMMDNLCAVMTGGQPHEIDVLV